MGSRERWVISSEWVEVWVYAGVLVFLVSLDHISRTGVF